METVRVIAGAKAPYALGRTLTRRSDDTNPPDYTHATAARFVVRASNGTEVEWAATLGTPTSQQVQAVYVFAADGSDMAVPTGKVSATYLVTPWVTITGVGEYACEPFNMIVTRTP